jgi:hypothetical protein
MERSWAVFALIISLVVIFIGCTCVAIAGVIGASVLSDFQAGGFDGLSFGSPTVTPVLIRPTPEAGSYGPGLDKVVQVSDETLRSLESSVVPANDLRDLAYRLEGKSNIPLTVSSPASDLTLGAQDTFWVTDVDTNENFQITTSLRYITDHSYFWIEDGISYDEDELRNLAEAFETEIYPTTRAFFGSEWSPGVDGDPHLYILYAQGLGSGLAGYFSSADENHPLAHEFSNAHEMFMLNADNIDLAEEFAYSVLAHEFQHMIHWNRDRNETSWINEGFAELAAFLNGYDVGSDWLYVRDPDLQLNDWPNNEGETHPHYGAAFLFLTYFLDRFGEAATQALIGHSANDLESIDQVLEEIGAVDPLDGRSINADDVFLDWTLASYIRDTAVSDGRYDYRNYPDAPQADETETVRNCPSEMATRDVHQYGVDYIRIRCKGDFALNFEGSTLARVTPVGPYSGSYAFWSNKGDESDMTLTRTFDFSDVQGPLTLKYRTWYDIESDYDYVYLVASVDGERWQILSTPSGTPEDPSGNSYGWGYNGEGGSWIEEQVDLSAFAGQQVAIRFEYVTDAVANGEGMLLDDIAIPEIGYFEDFEQEAGGWETKGWARIKNELPQTFRLALIQVGDQTSVQYIEPAADQTAQIPFSIDGDVDEVVLVVTGTTRFTRQKAAYRFEIEPYP